MILGDTVFAAIHSNSLLTGYEFNIISEYVTWLILSQLQTDLC